MTLNNYKSILYSDCVFTKKCIVSFSNMCAYIIILVIINLILIPHECFGQQSDSQNNIAVSENKDSTSENISSQNDTQYIPPLQNAACQKVPDSSSTENKISSSKQGDGKVENSQPVILLKRNYDQIKKVSRAATAEDVMQGIIVKTYSLNSEAFMGDTNYKFDRTLYINAPPGHYRLLIKAARKNPKYQSVYVENGSIEVFNPNLRTIRFILGGTVGVAMYKLKFGWIGNSDFGFDFESRHYWGLTGSMAYGFNTTKYLTKKDLVFPDTIQRHHSFLTGGGLSYGYAGMHFCKIITLIPKIAIGYWKLSDDTLYKVDFKNGINQNQDYYIDAWEKITHKYYYLKPGIELRVGYRVFGLRMSIENFIGENFGPFTINFGAHFRIL